MSAMRQKTYSAPSATRWHLDSDAKVGLHFLHVGGSLVPLPDWLEVDGAHLLETTLEQAHDEVAADKAAGACDDDEPFGVH